MFTLCSVRGSRPLCMKTRLLLFTVLTFFTGWPFPAMAQQDIPQGLQPWKDWVLRDDVSRHSPPLYSDEARRIGVWPDALKLEATAEGASFSLTVRAFEESWLLLPGGAEAWPQDVMAGGKEVPVLARNDKPALRLQPGATTITGTFRWKEMPERLPVPPQIGVLSLTTDGKPVEAPDWEPDGTLWLKRTRAEAADRDFLTVQVYRVIEDGIPMVLRTDIELSVAGKSREAELGSVLPEGWLLSSIETPVPCAVDDAGRMKVQVRAGKWLLQLTAFRTVPAETFRFAEGARPLIDTELVALKPAPTLRVIELRGITSIDVAQTTFPEKWRQLPVYLWETKTPFQIEEKLRGMGQERPPGLKFQREFWLDESGSAATYRDRLTGTAQRTWRLDAAAGHELGAVKIDGQGQLITKNPATQAHGIEVRTSSLALEATGRVPFHGSVPATGWVSSAESLSATLHLPPGWRLLAVFGPEYSRGDWLTAWSLLDVFLLLVFSLAVFRLWGWMPGLTALVVMIISWHEPGAPRWTLFILVAVMAFLRFVPSGRARKLGLTAKYASLLALAAVAAPFVSQQVTGMLFPQVETVREETFSLPNTSSYAMRREDTAEFLSGGGGGGSSGKPLIKSNLVYDKKAQIQTGPALPDWDWRSAEFGWQGPVTAKQSIHAVLLPPWVQRGLVVARLALFAALGWMVQRKWKPKAPPLPGGAVTALLVLAFGTAVVTPAAGQDSPPAQSPSPTVTPTTELQTVFPPKELLDQLRQRLTRPTGAFPGAAEIPSVKLTLTERELTMEAVIHTAAFTAVPLPGRLPSWSPVTVETGDNQPVSVVRQDGYLWIALPPGTHRVKVRGTVGSATEWQWSFELKPRHVDITAPGWTVTGVKPGGVPEAQVFFARQQTSADGGAAYDRRDFNAIVTVDRRIELGLVWQVRTTVTRLSATGKALAFSLPLLPGERILTGDIVPASGRVEVRLGAGDREFAWESELPVQPALTLAAEKTDRWIERWHLETSPVWNVGLSGLRPIFAAGESDLIPSWLPWPGEAVTLNVTRPEPVAGETTTVSSVKRVITLASQRRSTTLSLEVEASVGRDFPVLLPPDSSVTSLRIGGGAVPARIEAGKLIVPIRPGKQEITANWTESAELPLHAIPAPVSLPVGSSNITTIMKMPENRWILWTRGPLNGPAVRFWAVFAAAIIMAQILGRIRFSPLTVLQWSILLPGLTQIPLAAGGGFVLWLFWLALRGQNGARLQAVAFNMTQVVLGIGALCAAAVVIGMVRTGLLGQPTMFVLGKGSWRSTLQWYQDRAETVLPPTEVISVSIWVYRGLMLVWCLWLAFLLLRLVRWAWTQYSAGGLWKSAVPQPPAETGI